ncbi:MAG: hypothetical protein HQL30_03695 [Candidatus Omnitrophica bacterium]|nr:hypothetical protein [Candidatus Omnitrophota bacterium]
MISLNGKEGVFMNLGSGNTRVQADVINAVVFPRDNVDPGVRDNGAGGEQPPDYGYSRDGWPSFCLSGTNACGISCWAS